ncbi:trichohyalin-like isoform X24 [Branchiostoma floridae]|uniref:Trichohyalin-like isoform X23 n=2 Tax=Branchiostoma floridae TaxID=7739 RepID=A0A9J7HPZ1_BRAFL|nr:trichohyalin-like isoform X23 [Branchiostoma floridae]XP_035662296.1 trichohyalin-like isoform X24 [Branchiostoma floridae]
MVQPSKTKTMAKTGEGDSDQQSATEPSSNSVNGDNKKELMDSDEEEEVKEKPKETPKSYVPKMRGSVRGKFEEMQKQKEEEERRRAEEERKRRIEMDRQIQQQEQESLISKQLEESDGSAAAGEGEMFDKMETPSGPPSAAPPVTPTDLPTEKRRSIKGKFEEIQKQKEEEARMRAEEERLRRIEMDKLQLEREAARKAEEQEVSESDGDTSSSASFQPTVTDIPRVTRGGVKGKFEAMRKAKEEERLRQMEEERQQRIQAETESLRLSIEAAFTKAEEEEDVEEPEVNGLDTSPRLTKKIGSVKGRYEEMQKARDEEHRRQLETERLSRLQLEKQAIENESESTVSVEQVNGINGHSPHQQEEDKTYTSSESIKLRNRPKGDVKGRFEDLRKRREEEARRKTQEIRISRIEFDKMMQQREKEKTSQVEVILKSDEEEDGDSASVTSSLTSSFISDADGESGVPQPGTCGSMKNRFEALREAKEKPRTTEPRPRRLKKLDTFIRDTGKDNEEENEVNETNETTKPRKLDVKNRFEEMRKKREEAERRKTQEIRLSRLELDKIAQEREKERKEKDEVPCDDDNDDSPSEGTPLDISEPVPSVKDRLHQIKNSTEETQRKAQELQLSRLEFDKMMQEREKERNRKKEEEEDELAGSLEDLSGEPEKPMGSVKGRFEELRKVREEEGRRKAEEERLRRLEADRLAQERELENQAQQESASQANEEEAEDKPEVKEDIPPPKRGSLRGKFEVMQRQKEEEARKKAEEERLRRLEEEKKILAEEAAKREAEYEEASPEESLAETRETKRERRAPGKLKADYVTLRQRKEEEDRRKAEELRKSRLEFDRAELEREAERLREEQEQLAEQRAEEKEAEALKESIEDATSPKVSLGKLKNKFTELQKKKESGVSEDDGTPREKVKPGKLKNKFEELQKKSSEDQENDAGAEKAPKPGKLTISFEELARQKEEEARREAEEERKRKLEEDRQRLEEERARLEAEEAAAAEEGGDQEGEEPVESTPEESGPRLSVKERFALMQKKKEEEEEQRRLKATDVKEAGKNKRASALFEKFQNIDKVAEEERLRKVEEERARRLEMDREMLARELERTEKMVGMEEEAAEEAQEEEEEPKAAETEEDKVARKQRTRALFSRFENLESYEEQERRRRIEEEKRKRLMLEQREIDEARRKEVGGGDVTGTEELKQEEEAREREYMERFARGEASDVEDSDEDEPLSATSENLAPKFVKNFENMTIFDGDPVRFEAKVIGRPKPDVTWYLNGKRLPNNQDYRYKFEGDHGVVLELPETFPEDEGEYMCKAVNTSGMALCSALLIIEGRICKGHRAESSYIKQTVEPPRSAQPKASAKKSTIVKQQPGNVQVKQTVQTKSVTVQPKQPIAQQKQVHVQQKQAEIPPGKSEAVVKEQVVSKSEKITSTTSGGHFIKKSSSTTTEKVVTKTTSEVTSSKTEKSAAASAWELKYGGKPLTAQQLAKQKLAQKMAGNGKPPSPTVKVPVQKLYVGGKPAPAPTGPAKAPQSQGEHRPTEPQPGAARKQWPPPTKGGSDDDTTKPSEPVATKIKEEKTCNGDKADDNQTAHSNEKENKPPVKTAENGN